MNSNSTTGTKVNVPEAREAMNRFKYEVANEIGVPLKQGYNGDLTSAQNGYVGGYMVDHMFTERHNTFSRLEPGFSQTCYCINYKIFLYLQWDNVHGTAPIIGNTTQKNTRRQGRVL